jgi:glycosyltransferase involved in cell wall biosynthesis
VGPPPAGGPPGGVDLTVVTPTFRRERQVVEAVKSALDQEGVSVEVVVVDDSEEGSASAAIATLCDPRVTYIRRLTPSGGLPALARNDGVRLARGRYVCFLDDDDQLLPGCMHRMVAALDKNPTVGVAVGRVVSFGQNAEILRRNERWCHRAARNAALTSGWRRGAAAALLFGDSFTSACVIRREYVGAAGAYDPAVPLYEDVEFYTRAIRRFGHVFVDCRVLYRRTGEPSLTFREHEQERQREQAYEVMHRKYKSQYGSAEYLALRVGAKLFHLFDRHGQLAT